MAAHPVPGTRLAFCERNVNAARADLVRVCSEIREELGDALEITDVKPWAFRDDVRVKTYADGTIEQIYMIYLIFDCVSANREITFNEEFQAVAWVKPEALASMDLNVATRETFRQKGLL